jgi:hypothetical protein
MPIFNLRSLQRTVEAMRRSVTGNRLFDECFEAGCRDRIAAWVERLPGRAGAAGGD